MGRHLDKLSEQCSRLTISSCVQIKNWEVGRRLVAHIIIPFKMPGIISRVKPTRLGGQSKIKHVLTTIRSQVFPKIFF
jgi:hypothetical protein